MLVMRPSQPSTLQSLGIFRAITQHIPYQCFLLAGIIKLSGCVVTLAPAVKNPQRLQVTFAAENLLTHHLRDDNEHCCRPGASALLIDFLSQYIEETVRVGLP